LAAKVTPNVLGLHLASGRSAPRQVIGESSYVSAAAAPEQGLMTSLILSSAETARMNLFLGQVAQDFADYFVVMQVWFCGLAPDQRAAHSREDPLDLSTGLESQRVNPDEHL
jgi:hypothetical protein